MKRSKTLILIVILNLSCSMALLSQAQFTAADLERKLDAYFLDDQNKSSPGSAILVVKNKEPIFNKGYGLANLAYDIPITPNTVFDLASLAKQFTGYAIALLIEQGKLSEQDAITKYIPELPPVAQKITIRHLLHHTGGLRDWTTTFPLSGRSFDDVISFDQILRMVYEQEALNFNPGDQYAYSNTGYNLLAEIVQRVSGESFRSWTDSHIFQPLNMSNTFFLDNHREVIPNGAKGYYKSGDRYYQVPNNLTAQGSSSLYSSTSDLAKWVSHLLHPADRFQSAVKRMLQTDTLNDGSTNTYAYGIDVAEYRGTAWIAHSGSWASFNTYIALLPAHDLSIVVLNNSSEHNAYSIAREIASFYVSDSVGETEEKAAAEHKKVTLTQEVIDKYTGTYKLGTAWYAHINQKGNELWTRATAEGNFPMTPIADAVFRIKAYSNRTMTFKEDEDGKVTHLIYNDMICPKMSEDTTFTLTNAFAYTGNFYSTELNTLYKVILQDNALKLWSFHNGEIPLTPAWSDEFLGAQWFTNNIAFKRSEDVTISGLSISQYRARNQFFKKVSDDFK